MVRVIRGKSWPGRARELATRPGLSLATLSASGGHHAPEIVQRWLGALPLDESGGALVTGTAAFLPRLRGGFGAGGREDWDGCIIKGGSQLVAHVRYRLGGKVLGLLKGPGRAHVI